MICEPSLSSIRHLGHVTIVTYSVQRAANHLKAFISSSIHTSTQQQAQHTQVWQHSHGSWRALLVLSMRLQLERSTQESCPDMTF